MVRCGRWDNVSATSKTAELRWRYLRAVGFSILCCHCIVDGNSLGDERLVKALVGPVFDLTSPKLLLATYSCVGLWGLSLLLVRSKQVSEQIEIDALLDRRVTMLDELVQLADKDPNVPVVSIMFLCQPKLRALLSSPPLLGKSDRNDHLALTTV